MSVGNADLAPVSYWAADPRLSGLVSGYHRYRVVLPPGAVLEDVFFPSWAILRFAIDDPAPWSLRLGARTFDPVPEVSLTGPTSHAGYCRATRGSIVGIGLDPLGWARLIGADAEKHANRVTRCDTLPGIGALHDALRRGAHPPDAFDAWLLDRLDSAHEADPMIARIAALIADPAMTRIEAMADAIGVSPRTLAKVTRQHFGFTPKLLLRRCRFLRVLGAGLERLGDWNAVLDDAGYWDRSHFLRDSHLFLGCSIRDFLARRGPLNPMALKVRREVLGAPV